MDLLQSLVDYEKLGVPKGAGQTGQPQSFGLGRMHRLLTRLGSPHLRIPAVIHVVGSKGKGSVTTFLSSILRCAGLQVGSYTSPSLHSLTERINTTNPQTQAEQRISEGELEYLLVANWATIRKQVKLERDEFGAHLSHFEVLTALAFQHMATREVEVAVIEAGLGGVTDATNVFSSENVAATCLTSVGYEHVDVLGGSLESIAQAKSGIAKRGRPMVVGGRPQYYSPPVWGIIKETCHKQGAPLYGASEVVEWAASGDVSLGKTNRLSQTYTFNPISPELGGGIDAVSLQLLGDFQADNAALALATCLLLRQEGTATNNLYGVAPHRRCKGTKHAFEEGNFPNGVQKLLESWSARLTDQSFARGLERAWLPFRFHLLRPSDSSTFRCHPRGQVVLDGAHSAESARALVATFKTCFPSQPVVVIVAMAEDKDHREILKEIAHLEEQLQCVIVTSVAIAGARSRSAAPERIAEIAREVLPTRVALRSVSNLSTGLKEACAGPHVVLVTGSLHAAAEAGCLLGYKP